MSRRDFLAWLGAVSAGATLAACAPAPSSTRMGKDQVVQLVYQDWRTDWFPAMAQTMLEQFHESHPNIRVFYTPDPESFQERMLADMRAGTAADVFQGCCTHFPAWAQLGYTLDLRSYSDGDLDESTWADWDPAQVRALFLPEGHQFGLPKYHGALALYFNKDLLDEYGVDYPDQSWDHDDYLAAMQGLTSDRNGDDQVDLWGSMLDVTWDRLQVHVNAWGGHFVDPQDSTRCRMDEPESLAALEWIRARMWDDRVMATPLDVQNMSTRQAFIGERVAMVEDGSWALKDILTGARFRVGVAPMPAGPERRVTLATTDGFGIYSRTQNPDAAWELVKFLVGPDYGRAMAEASFLQPARRSLVGEWVTMIREAYPDKITEEDILAFADGQINGYSVTAEIFANMADAKRLTDLAWNSIFALGQAPVEETMRTVCRLISETQQRDE